MRTGKRKLRRPRSYPLYATVHNYDQQLRVTCPVLCGQDLTSQDGDLGHEADRKKTDQLVKMVLIKSAESKTRFMERGR